MLEPEVVLEDALTAGGFAVAGGSLVVLEDALGVGGGLEDCLSSLHAPSSMAAASANTRVCFMIPPGRILRAGMSPGT
jgi:hypothetical protein